MREEEDEEGLARFHSFRRDGVCTRRFSLVSKTLAFAFVTAECYKFLACLKFSRLTGSR